MNYKIFLFMFIAVSMAFIFSGTAAAASNNTTTTILSSDYNINTGSNNTIYVSTQGNDSWNGLSSTYNKTTGSGPKASIINATGTVADNGTIYVANGIYYEHIIITKNLKLIGQSQNNTIIDGSNNGQPIIINNSCILTITNFTIENGQTTTDGGGVANWGDSTIINCNIWWNTAGYCGGGILNYLGMVTVNDSNIENTIMPPTVEVYITE